MVKWTCDICEQIGTIHPETVPMMESRVVKMEVPDPKDLNKKIIKEIKQEIPLTTTLRRQDTQTGKIKIHVVPKSKDLTPRAMIVSLKFGSENIQKDFCVKCYNEHISKHVELLFSKLEKIESR